jgi:NAD(P)H-dependent FMN reductase
MPNERPLNIPVLLGTVRKGRASAHAANFLVEQVRKRNSVVTELIDIINLPLPVDDAGEAIKNKDFSEKINAADGLVLVVPEYNHSFPGLLKHVLDSNLMEYVHKPVGIAGVSAGPFGGTRVIENCLAPMRELGLVTIFFDVNFGNVGKLFDAAGNLLDPAFLTRTDKFLNELIWMAKTLREHISLK